MGWIRKPAAHDAELTAALHRLAQLEAEAERRKVLALRLDARRRPPR